MNIDLNEASQSFGNLVRMIGAITVAFFILLGAFIYISYYRNEKILEVVEASETKIFNLDKKVEDAISAAKLDSQLQNYFQRRICENTADTENEKIACNPPPSLTSPSR